MARNGKYKSAVEPYIREDLSEESEMQLNELLEKSSGTFVSAVSAKTGLSADKINALLNSEPQLMAGFGYEQGLIDSLVYAGELEQLIKARIGIDSDEELKTVSNGRYARVSNQSAGLTTPSTDNKIAVIYANGPIIPEMDGDNPFDTQQYITSGFFGEQLEDIRDDDNVKALVVRINSPGGSGSTSDVIWRMLQEVKQDMPVIVSMGPVAASGGYYIAMAADTIIAEPTTITGSIGVLATKFNTNQLFNEELGITFDGVKSHQYADWLLPTNDFSPTEEKAFRQFVDRFYDTFITKVAEARGMTKEQVHEVAQGRVWTGSAAMEQGLVDALGGMQDAMDIAAQQAELDTYKVDVYPKKKELFDVLMGSAEARARVWVSDMLFGFGTTQARDVLSSMSVLQGKGPLAYFPYEISIQ